MSQPVPAQREHTPDQAARPSLWLVLWRGAVAAVVPLVIAFCTICVVGVVAGLVLVGRHGGSPHLLWGFDQRVERWFPSHRAHLVSVSKGLAQLGSPVGWFVITVVIGAVLWLLGARVRAFVPFVAFLGAEIIVFVLKHVIDRHRPPTASGPLALAGVHETDLSFPSGHSTAAAAVLFALAGLAALTWRIWWPWVIAFVLGFVMPWSRLVLGVHWFTDVAIGAVLGAAWGTVVALCLREPDVPLREPATR